MQHANYELSKNYDKNTKVALLCLYINDYRMSPAFNPTFSLSHKP